MIFRKIKNLIKKPNQKESELHILLMGKMIANQIKQIEHIENLGDVEFKVFSQFGDDGIIQWLIHKLDIPNKTFIEFGVENYIESTTRFLMMNDNWSGLVMDGNEANIKQIKNSDYFWRHDLLAECVFIDKENINDKIKATGFHQDVGILHIDIDGNDYWIWEEINAITPIIVILEYNSVFGIDRSITVPYDKEFNATNAHYSNLYFGASLRALDNLCAQKGYQFIGCNSAGNNAYFIRNDKLNEIVSPTAIEEGYVMSKFRQSRNSNGELTYARGEKQLDQIKGMPIYNTISKRIEPL